MCRFVYLVLASVTLSFITSTASSQVVRFRLEATDAAGVRVETVRVGEPFQLTAFAEQVGGFTDAEEAGVFAAYLDVDFDPTLATVDGEVSHSEIYASGISAELGMPGLLDNIGGFSVNADLNLGFDPIGAGENVVFSVPFLAIGPGELNFVGSESLSYPTHDVLVYGSDTVIPAREIDFGAEDLRIDFGAVSLTVASVPEPGGMAMLLTLLFLPFALRRRRLPG